MEVVLDLERDVRDWQRLKEKWTESFKVSSEPP